LRDTPSQREPTISHNKPRHDVALGAWTVPLKTHGLALRSGGSALEQHNEPRSVTGSTRNGTSQGSLRICARRTSTALPKRNPLWLRRSNKKCLPYPAPPSRGTAQKLSRLFAESRKNRPDERRNSVSSRDPRQARTQPSAGEPEVESARCIQPTTRDDCELARCRGRSGEAGTILN